MFSFALSGLALPFLSGKSNQKEKNSSIFVKSLFELHLDVFLNISLAFSFNNSLRALILNETVCVCAF